jgi:hypothetical protein
MCGYNGSIHSLVMAVTVTSCIVYLVAISSFLRKYWLSPYVLFYSPLTVHSI